MSRRNKPIRLVFAASVVITTLAALVWWHRINAWHLTLLESSPIAPGVEYRRIRVSHRDLAFEATCVVFDRAAARCEVIDLRSAVTTSLDTVARQHDSLIVVNGGYFDVDRKPVGLLRIAGQTISAPSTRPSLSGCVTVDQAGQIAVTALGDPSVATAYSAIQAGPFLIDPGGEIGIRSDSAPPTERTIVVTENNKFCVLCTTPVTLLDLSRCLKSNANTFGLTQIQSALNLDGGRSTGFAIQTHAKRVVREPRGPLRDVLSIGPAS